MVHSKSKRILGMTFLQVGILLGMGCFAIICLGMVGVFLFPGASGGISSTPTSTTKYPPTIMGLTQSSVASYLSAIGISCSPVRANDPYGYNAFCLGKSSDGMTEASVSVGSRDKDDNVYIIVVVLYQYGEYSDQTAKEILGNIAAIPYNNAELSMTIRNGHGDN